MAIEIYDKAAVIQKGDTIFYLLKHGSKNSYMCAGQSRIEGDFRRKWFRRDVRDSDWRVIAVGTPEQHRLGLIGDTYWNATTGMVYGDIRFAKNIALYLARQTPKPLDSFDPDQQSNIAGIIAVDGAWFASSVIDLGAIPAEKKLKLEDTYGCWGEGDVPRKLSEHSVEHGGRLYWNLNNL